MPKNYGTYSDPLDVPRKKDVDAVASEVASKYSATNPPPYPVKSVNNKTGAVTLSASDVGAVNISGDVMEGGLYAATNAMIAYTDPQVRNECFLDEATFTGHEDAGDWGTFFENKSQQICWKFE
nr:MAG TPA: hypothetical protein [Caudoviricetes sp.]